MNIERVNNINNNLENFREKNTPVFEKEKRISRLEGVDFNINEVKEAMKADKPLQISIAFPRQKCNLNCLYCYTSEFKEQEKTISISKILELFNEAKNIGIKNLLIPGYGEPFLNKEIWPMLDEAKKLGIYTTIFTNGGTLDKEQIEKLNDYPISLIVKCNTLNEEKEDRIAGVKNYAAKRNKFLEMAIEAGFNQPNENGNTRLGIATMIYKDNADDVVELVDWAKERNITPMISGTMLTGNAKNNQDILGETKELNNAFSEVNRKIIAKSNDLYKQLFTPKTGNVVSGTLSVYLEYPSGKIVDDFYGSHQIGNIGSDSLADGWSKNKGDRETKSRRYQEKIQDLENIADIYEGRINYEALEQKRNEYLGMSVKDVFNNNRSKIKNIIKELNIGNNANKKAKIENLFSRLLDLTRDDILAKHGVDKFSDVQKDNQNIINEYPENKIKEYIDFQLKEYMGGENYNKLIKKIEQPDIKIYDKSIYSGDLEYEDPLVNSDFWSKGDYKFNQLYLPKDKNVAISFVVAAKALGHFVSINRNEVANDFNSSYQEENRAWNNGWQYLEKRLPEYFEGEENPSNKIEPIYNLTKRRLLEIMELSKIFYKDDDSGELGLKMEFYESEQGKIFLLKIKDLESEVNNKIIEIGDKRLLKQIDWEKFCGVINNVLLDIERENKL